MPESKYPKFDESENFFSRGNQIKEVGTEVSFPHSLSEETMRRLLKRIIYVEPLT